ncbi:hypothetical protein ISCGN_008959 [Ixodes scapularis]
MDNRLAHLLEAKKALFDRWKGQRLNCRLRKKIAELNRTIEDHCQSLTRQQRDEVYNSVDGQMRVGGSDGISNRALRNLEDGSIEFLTDEINRIWEQGCVPESWKTATVVLIPKPGRPPGLANLRPISLTSCVGKVAECVIHNRISRHIEGKNLFPCMIGFRPSLSTQDAMKLLKHQIFNRKTRDVRAILGLDLEKAFDSITHAHILDSISELGLGDMFHKFVRFYDPGKPRSRLAILGPTPRSWARKASTERLMQLGAHNTLEEIIEAQETAQHNVGRRRARAVALLRHVRDEPRSACFVDAAQYGCSASFAAVAIDHQGSILNSASFKDSTPSRAEQAAIALALLDNGRSHIYTDFRSAVRAFASNSISDEASKILGSKIISPHTITWFPAHLDSQQDSLTNLNDTANSRARALTLRAGKDADLQGGYLEFKDIVFTFNEVTTHYRMGRRTFPPPHGKLSRSQAITLRMLPTRSYPSLAFFSIIAPDTFKSSCPDCGSVSSFDHMLWRCPSLRGPNQVTEEEWSSAITSSELLPQLRAVQRAHDAVVRFGLPVPTWERPAVLPQGRRFSGPQ